MENQRELTVSASEAKSRLAEWLQHVMRGDLVLITRHGKPVAALVPAEEISQLRRLRAAGPQAGLASLAGGWPGSESLVEALSGTERTLPRAVPDMPSE